MISAIEGNVMVNPINDSTNVKNLDASVQVSQTTSPSQENQDETSVNLSEVSKQVAALKAYILNSPQVDKARVEFLKEELANGNYQILSDKIATKMVDDVELV